MAAQRAAAVRTPATCPRGRERTSDLPARADFWPDLPARADCQLGGAREGLKLVLVENITHRLLVDVNTLPGFGLLEVDILNIDIEIAAALLLEKTHMR